MLTTKSKLEILFNNEADHTILAEAPHSTRTTVIRGHLRDICTDSSALGIEELAPEVLGLTQEEMNSGTPVGFDLLQVTNPISVRATCERYGPQGSNYVSVTVKINLASVKASYAVEYPVCEVYVDNVSLPRLYKRLERILKDVPSIAAPLLAN